MIARYRPISQDSRLLESGTLVFQDPRRPEEAEIGYEEAVAQAKQIIAKTASCQMRLGELADKIEKGYGEQRLRRFAADIGIAACTLERCRSVFRAWENQAPAPKSYSVAQELQAHPHRFELIRNNPDMTKREARRIMRRLRTEQTQANFATHQREEQKRWFRAVIRHAGETLRDAAIADGEVSLELRQALRDIIEPTLLATLREAGSAVIRLADFLEQIAREEDPREQLLAEAAE